MRVIVTAAALIITPGVELKLTPEDAKLRKHCMTHVAGGVYRATLENHYKTGEIVEFAGIREYIEEPIRTYSSGMVARLGFAVASHVDAEILIVDESLAVGDYQFVQKCYRFIRRFQMRGGTILFVSHSAGSIKDIATRCLWVEEGVVQMDGDPDTEMTANDRLEGLGGDDICEELGIGESISRKIGARG